MGTSATYARVGITTLATTPSILSDVFYSSGVTALLTAPPGAPWRPPQWSGQASFTIMPVQGANGQTVGAQQIYVFDGAIRAEHEQQTVVTLNPVQTGAAITDHAYTMPARLTVELAMSDAMQSYTVGQWSTGPTKSTSAFQTLKALQLANTPLYITTPLCTYPIMMITDCRAEETKDTKYALKATVTFTQILTALVQANQATLGFDMTGVDTSFASPDAYTVSPPTDEGQAQGQPVTPTTQSIYGSTPVGPGETPLTGAGTYSSTPTPLTTGATPVKPGETPLTKAYIVPLTSAPNQILSVSLPGIQ